MSETRLVRELMLEATKLGARAFRNNTGVGWVGNAQVIYREGTVRVHPGDVVVRKARPLRAGLCEGSSDTIGWADGGRFLAIEAKVGAGRLTQAQDRFLSAVRAAGGIAGVCRSVDDLRALLEHPPP